MAITRPPHLSTSFGRSASASLIWHFDPRIWQERSRRAAPLAFADADAVAAAYAALEREPPSEAGSGGGRRHSLETLRALPARALRAAMAALGISFTPGLEKEEYVQQILEAEGAAD